MDGIQELGPEFADAKAFEAFQAEARALLFRESRLPPAIPSNCRLAIAREEALTFKAEARRAIEAELEKSRFPTAREFVEIPLGLLKGTAMGLREIRGVLGEAAATARNLARVVTSKGLKAAAEELRRARTSMPGQFATAFERAGGLARQGGQSLKRHYEFVLEAQELRARYAELLSRAPELSEKGKQFLARLELERRAELFRETSSGAIHWARQALVVGIAYLIAGLQFVQAKITPPEHKQLAQIRTTAPEPVKREPEEPLRVLLLPASCLFWRQLWPGGPCAFVQAQDSEPGRTRRGRWRDLVTGDVGLPRRWRSGKSRMARGKRPEAAVRSERQDGAVRCSKACQCGGGGGHAAQRKAGERKAQSQGLMVSIRPGGNSVPCSSTFSTN